MNESIKAEFSFTDYRIPEASVRFKKENNDNEELSLGLAPKGVYDIKEGDFELTLNTVVSVGENPDNYILKCTLIANYKFKEKISLEQIPDFFYKSCLAIIFPYVRAFLSTMSLQANTNLYVLPTVNLTSLDRELKDNTTAKK